MKIFFAKVAAFCVLVLLLQVPLSLDWQWLGATAMKNGRIPIHVSAPDPDRYDAGDEIRIIQQYQKVNTDLGFTWRENIDTSDGIILQWGDIPAGAISTDMYGFANPPQAIDMLRSATPVDIIGVGSSYMGGAAGLFHDYFWLKGLFFYSMAHGRYTPPQFTIAQKKYATPLKPRLIIYGLNEESIHMMDDFNNWKKSGMDWFAYHCGSWCGPAIKLGFPYDQLRRYKPLYRLYYALSLRLFRHIPTDLSQREKKRLTDMTFEYIREACKDAQRNNAAFIVLCIPSKARILAGPSDKLFLFEQIVPRFDNAGIPYIDLRESFAKAEDPRDLYFTIDNHWSRKGIYIAAQEIIRYMQNAAMIQRRS